MSRKRWDAQNGLELQPPTSSDAASIIEFARSVRGTEGMLLCHCGGGMSRAPAAALICLSVWAAPGSEVRCVESIARARQGAAPHAGLARFADALLDRGGTLVDALSSQRR